MKVVSSLKSLKKRDLNNKLIKRKGKLYVINKKILEWSLDKVNGY
jgi:Ribosomal protein L36.